MHQAEKETINVFGDSHTFVFNQINETFPYSRFYFNVLTVHGATAQGMVNPNSQTNALEIFYAKIDEITNKNEKIIFLLGEVDTGFVIWYRAMKYNETVEFQMERSITNYFNFLIKLNGIGFTSIYVMSAPLPTIKDSQEWSNVTNLRREITNSQEERTELTLQYNKRLQEECLKNGFTFIGFDGALLDQKTGIIKPIYLNDAEKYNHHLKHAPYGKLCYEWCDG